MYYYYYYYYLGLHILKKERILKYPDLPWYRVMISNKMLIYHKYLKNIHFTYIYRDNRPVMYYCGFAYLMHKPLQHKAVTGNIKPLCACDYGKSDTEKENYWTKNLQENKYKKSHEADFLTLILLKWKIWWAPNNASSWKMGYNSVFKGLRKVANKDQTAVCQVNKCHKMCWFKYSFQTFCRCQHEITSHSMHR